MTIETAHDTPPTWLVDLEGGAATIEDRGPQGQLLRPVVAEGLCHTTGLSAGRVRMPPDAQAVPHHHDEDRAVVVLAGIAATLIAPPGATRWDAAAVTGPGDIVFLPGGGSTRPSTWAASNAARSRSRPTGSSTAACTGSPGSAARTSSPGCARTTTPAGSASGHVGSDR
ncbi:hypothetical protein [Amycolatopsis sp. WGS_07]|uniref:hypothetical protein n=1 Tax=Amycolatopsis sp. WGS_07 TaxID=3076764 RepID=UPI003872B240